MKTHKDLDVWKLGIDLVEIVYIMTKKFPKEELYGLVNQMRRAAVSIPSNIAEGAARASKLENLRFLNISLGSLAELETQVIIAQRLNYCEGIKELDAIEILRKKLLNLIKYFSSK